MQEEVWMSGDDYSSAVADPLREFAVKIVDDMNQKHWEDVRRFTNVYAGLDVEVQALYQIKFHSLPHINKYDGSRWDETEL